MKITTFENILKPGNPVYKDSEDVLSDIAAGKYASQVAKVRQAQGKERQKPKLDLKAIVWQGVFKYRNSKSITAHSGIATMDFDHVKDAAFFRDYIFNNYSCVYAAFISPSGEGVKVLVHIPVVSNDKEYKEYYNALLTYFPEAKADPSTKDIGRVCFVSDDKDLKRRQWTQTTVFDERASEQGVQLPVNGGNGGVSANPLDIAALMIRKAAEGQKHFTLLKASRLLGGYVAGGLVDYQDATELLEAEISRRNVDNMETARRTIQDGLKYGQITPVVEAKVQSKVYTQSGVITQQAKPQTAKTDNKEDTVQPKVPYIRVGTSYYKRITKTDRYGVKRTELKVWRKEEIITDHGRGYIHQIPTYDDFTMKPDNITFEPIIDNCYNLYKPFSHTPAPGSWDWTEILIKHIFGEQYELGMRYLQALYLYPARILPVLVLVSKERQTGKTTFINWLNMIFGGNMVNITPEGLMSSFNFHYCSSNIIAIEETIFDKTHAVDKIKSLSTAKVIDVNPKGVNPFQVPFYGKIILTSNSEDRVLKIDQYEIRFFIRKINKPDNDNHNIEANLIDEIPAFLHHLTTLAPINFSKDRTGFTPEELKNTSLDFVKSESRSTLYKELFELLYDFFNNEAAGKDRIHFDPLTLKTRFFERNYNVSTSYITKVLKEEFHILPQDNPGWQFLLDSGTKKKSRYYTIDKEYFNIKENEPETLPF